mgnify:FL=1
MTKILSKYSLILMKNSATISKLSLLILPKTSSKTITNVIDVAGYLNIDYVRPGQTLVATGPFTDGTTVVSVDTGANTITVNDFPATTQTNVLTRVSPAPGEYYIPSASFYDPNSATPITTKNITGSQDAEYNGSTPIYSVLGTAATPSQVVINGEFHQYEISEVFYRNAAGTEASIYITWGEPGTEAASGTELYIGSNQTLPIIAQTSQSALAPIFATSLPNMGDVAAGSNLAAYQIALVNFLDELGTSNTSGTSGTSGSSGSSGTSGTDGTSGSSGTSGTDGSSGSSGTSGTDGSSGSSGTSGTATISNLGNNRVTTSTGVQGELNAESNLTFDGTFLSLTGSLNIHSAGNASITTGQTEVLSFPTTTGKSVNFDYVVYNGTTDLRAGTVMAVWNNVDATYTDFSTPDLNGDTEAITFSVTIVSGDVKLFANVASGTWDLDIATRIIF